VTFAKTNAPRRLHPGAKRSRIGGSAGIRSFFGGRHAKIYNEPGEGTTIKLYLPRLGGLPGGLNGRQLADEARKRRPDLLVLHATGYARNAIVHQGRLDPGVELITKPFTFSSLALKVNAVFERRQRRRAPAL
jgi:hypothetical protein